MNKRSCRVVVVIALAVLWQVAHAHQKPERAPLPNFDVRESAGPQIRAAAGVLPEQAAALSKLQARVPGVKVERDDILGTARLVSAAKGFLTGPNGEGRGVSASVARAIPSNDPHRAVKSFVNDHGDLFGHTAALLDAAQIARDYTTPHNGLRTTVWQQQLDGVPVFEGRFTSHVTRNGELVSVAAHFVPQPALAADNFHGNRAAVIAAPAITAQQALVLAARNVGDEQELAEVVVTSAPDKVAERRQRLTGGAIRNDAEAKLVWLPMSQAAMRLCWELVFTSKSRGEMFRVLVDATTGEPLVRHCLTSYASPASYRVYTSDSPTPFSPGHSVPSGTQPPYVSRELVTITALDPVASPNGWIDDGVNETRGNNVDAHTDRNADDLPDLPRPQGSPDRTFDFPIDFGRPPTAYSSAAVVQLFYLCNVIHDRFYALGFTEAAGNFQVNNFGRGGVGNDAVMADAQDGDGFNNANFSTPPDGSPGRMQMFIFSGPEPDIDGDFDAEIVIHEYTHGLSNRRVGNGVGISRLATAGMGEGWSDFYALCLLSEAGDDLDANYAAGGYATRQFFGLQENYYFGIRRYPYTTDMSKNPLTFRDIDPSQYSTHPGVPISSVGGFGFPAQVHNQGEVWCVTLWEARANLIRKHGFAAGNQLILRLVTDAMGLGPANPNFVEARDAILQADQILTGGDNELELWRAFAKRGLGAYATAPVSTTTTGLRESFDLPDDLLISPLTDLSAAGPVGGPFDAAEWVFTLTNTGTNDLGFVARTGGLIEIQPAAGILAGGGVSISVTARLSSVVVNLPAGAYSDTLSISNTVSGATQRRFLTMKVGEARHFTEHFGFGSNDLENIRVTLTPDGSASHYDICRESATTFPTSVAGATQLSLSDDSYAMVNLGGAEVSIYGRRASRVFVGSNGYLTFDEGETTFSESLATHFRLPRVAGLFLDLDPGEGGAIYSRQLADRLAVTWQGVPEFGTANVNSFQIEMFFDGRIRITHLQIDADDGLVGVSAGNGTPPDFLNTDWSALGSCAGRLVLSIPATVPENAGVLDESGLLTLTQPATSQLTITLTSSDPSTVRVPATVVIPAGGSSAAFNLEIVDDALIDGTTRARITASAVGNRTGEAIVSVVDNEVATLSVELPATAREGDGVLIGAGLLTVTPAPDRTMLVRLASSDLNELAIPNGIAVVQAGQTSARFDLRVVDDGRLDGTQVASITPTVEGWPSTSATVSVADNEATDLRVSMVSVVTEGSGTVTNGGLIALSGTVISNVVVSLTSLDTTELTVPAAVTVLPGQNFARFNLTVVDDTVLDDTQTVAVVASAVGFLSGSNTTRVADNEFPIPAFFPSPANGATFVRVDSDLAWSSGEGEQLINGDFELGELTGWTREGTGLGGFVIDNGTFDPESPDGPVPPYAGNFSALNRQQNPGRRAIYQDVFIPLGATFATLRWVDRIRNHAQAFGSGQAFKVELRDLAGQATSVLFETAPGHPLLNDWTNRFVDLGAFRGRNLRLIFSVVDELGFLNVHLDNVSLQVGSPAPTAFDVYFGTNPVPGAAEFVGTISNTFWELPPLTQWTTYYWQIISRREFATVPGPVWSFTTRGGASTRTLVRAGSVWKYLDDGSNQGTGWRNPGFDDRTWLQGAARLGYGGDGEITTVRYGNDPNNKHITTYFRQSFVVSNAASCVNLLARVARDDGAVVYLNGNEIIRDNMFGGFLDYRTEAINTVNSPNETAFFSYTADPRLLVDGTNVVAIEIHQVSSSSSDMGMDFDLVGIFAVTTNLLPSAVMTGPTNYSQYLIPTNVILTATASDPDGTIRRIEFFSGTNKLGEDTIAPYSYTWANPPSGIHSITAVATDNSLSTNSSFPIHIVVNRTGNMPLTLVPFGATWRYLDTGIDPGGVWMTTNYNDEAWSQGRAEFGYGDGDETTIINYGPNPNARYVATYFRHAFTNTAAVSALNVGVVRDDGAVVYLNGVEVFRSNMPSGIISYLSLASSAVNPPAESQPFVSAINPALLRRGRNVIAVEIHQSDVGSSDVSFNLELTATGNLLPTVALTSPANETTLTAPPTVPVTATAYDRYGNVARVDFFSGADLIGSDSNAPFALAWQPPAGAHPLTAVATDNSGGTNRSEVVLLNVLPLPTLSAYRAGDAVELAWPSTAFEFSLESALWTTPSLFWSPVTNPVVNAAGEFRTIVPVGPTNQYFRLIRP